MTLRDIRRFQRVEPDGYLALSRRLAALGDAVSFRSAVDRAYYAAFLTAREELSGKGYGPFSSSSRAHAEVGEALRRTNKPAYRRLRILRQARNRLTYRIEAVDSPGGQSLGELLNLAQGVINAAAILPPAPPPPPGLGPPGL